MVSAMSATDGSDLLKEEEIYVRTRLTKKNGLYLQRLVIEAERFRETAGPAYDRAGVPGVRDDEGPTRDDGHDGRAPGVHRMVRQVANL